MSQEGGHGNSTIVGPNSQTELSDWKAVTKDRLGVASRFAQTLLKKVPECVDANPVKVAFSIARVIIEIKDVGYYFVSWAQANYYIRRLGTTKTSLHSVSKIPQTDSWLWRGR
jgi:hypothetical protein